jgi:hypothetical protein
MQTAVDSYVYRTKANVTQRDKTKDSAALIWYWALNPVTKKKKQFYSVR